MIKLQIGFFVTTNTENGKRMVLYCGFMATVRFSRLFCLMAINSFPYPSAGAGKSILW
jgi:hypothetical protein